MPEPSSQRGPPPSRGFCLWITGLPSSGKTTLARKVAALLKDRGRRVELLDGDEIRAGLSADLGFDRVSREAHAGRVSYIAKVLARNDVIPIVALISPYRSSRAKARAEIGRFVEVYVDTPLEVCESRDVKGLYRKARSGALPEMTGVNDPYEPPDHPEVVVHTTQRSAREEADYLLAELTRLGWLTPDSTPPVIPGTPR